MAAHTNGSNPEEPEHRRDDDVPDDDSAFEDEEFGGFSSSVPEERFVKGQYVHDAGTSNVEGDAPKYCEVERTVERERVNELSTARQRQLAEQILQEVNEKQNIHLSRIEMMLIEGLSPKGHDIPKGRNASAGAGTMQPTLQSLAPHLSWEDLSLQFFRGRDDEVEAERELDKAEKGNGGRRITKNFPVNEAAVSASDCQALAPWHGKRENRAENSENYFRNMLQKEIKCLISCQHQRGTGGASLWDGCLDTKPLTDDSPQKLLYSDSGLPVLYQCNRPSIYKTPWHKQTSIQQATAEAASPNASTSFESRGAKAADSDASFTDSAAQVYANQIPDHKDFLATFFPHEKLQPRAGGFYQMNLKSFALPGTAHANDKGFDNDAMKSPWASKKSPPNRSAAACNTYGEATASSSGPAKVRETTSTGSNLTGTDSPADSDIDLYPPSPTNMSQSIASPPSPTSKLSRQKFQKWLQTFPDFSSFNICSASPQPAASLDGQSERVWPGGLARNTGADTVTSNAPASFSPPPIAASLGRNLFGFRSPRRRRGGSSNPINTSMERKPTGSFGKM